MKDLIRFPTTKVKAKGFKASVKHAARQHAKQELRLLSQEAMEEIENPSIIMPDYALALNRLMDERNNYAL